MKSEQPKTMTMGRVVNFTFAFGVFIANPTLIFGDIDGLETPSTQQASHIYVKNDPPEGGALAIL